MIETVACDLCVEGTVPAEDAEDMRCYGCGALVCDRHHIDPIGQHVPEDHGPAEDDW